MKKIVGLILVLFCNETLAQVTHASKTDKVDGDFYYALPKTAIVMDFTITRTTYTKGKDFAKSFFKTNPTPYDSIGFRVFGVNPKIYDQLNKSTITGAKVTEWELGDMKVTQAARRDETKIYKVKGKKSFLKHNSLTFAYGDDGVLLSGELSSESQVFDAVVKGISGIASIIGSVVRAPSTSTTLLFHDDLKGLSDLLTQYDQTILNSLNPSIEVYKDKKALLTDRITSEFGRLFYSTKTKTYTVSVAYIPANEDKEKKDDVIVFKFDDANGGLSINDKIKQKISIVTTYAYSFTELAKGHSLSIDCDTDNLSAYFNPRVDKNMGFAYNVSTPAKITYKNEGTVKDVQRLKIAQYGIVSYINPDQKKYSFELDPLTGDLKKITAETSSVTGDNVSAAAGSATDVIKLLKGDDEKTKLQNRYDKLDLKKKIKELEDQGYQ